MQSRFLPTKKMAQYLGYHPDYLRKNIGIFFFENEHFFRPQGAKQLRWDVVKMTQWLTNSSISTTAKDVLNKILA